MAVKKIGALLVAKNIITQVQLDQALAESARTRISLVETLASKGFTD